MNIVLRNLTTLATMLATICLTTACHERIPPPLGRWQSAEGHPDITITRKSTGECCAIVHHRTTDGDTCSIEYPIVETALGAYIQAYGRVLLSYDVQSGILFVSPGGKYQRKIDTVPNTKLESAD